MRALIAIGCNSYEGAPPLAAAEVDAERMYGALLRPDVGEYDAHASRLLLSPTLQQVRDAIREVLLDNDKVETFTFFFAGHGGVSHGGFYMWVKDTSPTAQALSALSLSEVFRCLAEAAPRQANLIIDACESGGLVADLGAMLKPELLGDAGTPALTLVATSAQDQAAAERSSGGIGTSAILDCIEGRDFVQDSSSVLDLVEIGKRVSARLRDSGQSPVVWGLNLDGPPQFCRNPRFASDATAPLRQLIREWPLGGDASVHQYYRELWSAYSSLVEGDLPRNSLPLILERLFAEGNLGPDAIAVLADRIAATFLTRAAVALDAYQPSQVAACVAASLLPYVGSASINQSASRLVLTVSREIVSAGNALMLDLREDRFALLSSRNGGVCDLFRLPTRIARILGWSAVACEVASADFKEEAEDMFSQLVRLVIGHYEESVVAISDAQAPHWAAAIACSRRLGLEEAEHLAGLVFQSLVACKGQLARWDLPPQQVIKYLLHRKAGDFSGGFDTVERPIETLTVLLRLAPLMDLGSVFDESLWKLDGLSFSAYIPDDARNYSLDFMKGGQNLIWTVGQDVFRCSDLQTTWGSVELPKDQLIRSLALISSIIHEDRVPWLLLDSVA